VFVFNFTLLYFTKVPNLGAQWTKVYVLHAVLNLEFIDRSSYTWPKSSGNLHPMYYYDFALFLDSDACFVLGAPSIENHILNQSDADFFIARDFVPRHADDFNTGVVGCRNNDWSRWWLFFWLANPECSLYFGKLFFEQSCVEKLQYLLGYDQKRIKGHMKIYSNAQAFNSFTLSKSLFIYIWQEAVNHIEMRTLLKFVRQAMNKELMTKIDEMQV
jgi:hypothetical protein